MDLAAPGQLPAPPPQLPQPCASCQRTILPGERHAKVEATAPAEEGFLCGLCWGVARGALVAFGAGLRERERQTTPGPPPR